MTNLYSIGDLVRWKSGGKEAPVSEVIPLKEKYCYMIKGCNRPISECELTLVRRQI
jgi:hypothetical protein